MAKRTAKKRRAKRRTRVEGETPPTITQADERKRRAAKLDKVADATRAARESQKTDPATIAARETID